MLKRQISSSEFGKLTPAVQELYNVDGDNYVLDVEDSQTSSSEDIGELKRALARTKQDLKDNRAELKKAADTLAALDTEDARKRGDVEKLSKQWDDEKDALIKAHSDEVAGLREHIRTSTIDAIVSNLTTSVTGSKENAALLDPHVRSKLEVEFTDEGVQVMMKTDAGPVPLDLEKFEKTVVDNPAYAAIIVSSKASGGGAPESDTQRQQGGAFPTDNNTQASGPIDKSTMDPADLAKSLRV